LFFSKEVRTIRRSEENEGAGYSSYKEEEDFLSMSNVEGVAIE